MQITDLKLSEITPYKNNPRNSDDGVAVVKKSISEFGFQQPLVIDKNNVIVVGHTRYKAAVELGHETVPCLKSDELSDEQIKAYRIMDNKSSEFSTWDFSLLTNEINSLMELDFDVGFTGFDDKEIADLNAEFNIEEGLTDEDAVPEVPESPVTVEGDVWILGNHRLMCGDSTSIDVVDKLMDGNKADMVFTDPPYGVDYDGGHAVKGVRRDILKNDGTVDIYNDVLPVIYTATKDGSPLYLWFSDSKSLAVLSAVLSAGYEVRNTLIWNKNVAQFGAIGAQYKSKHEPCLYCFKKGNPPFWAGVNNEVSVWDINRAVKNEFHPTQKPVELAERALKNSSKGGDSVIDLFGGSGSTLIACEKNNRLCRMMELDPKYCDVIINRWQDYTGENAILESTGKTKARVYNDESLKREIANQK